MFRVYYWQRVTAVNAHLLCGESSTGCGEQSSLWLIFLHPPLHFRWQPPAGLSTSSQWHCPLCGFLEGSMTEWKVTVCVMRSMFSNKRIKRVERGELDLTLPEVCEVYLRRFQWKYSHSSGKSKVSYFTSGDSGFLQIVQIFVAILILIVLFF